MPPTRTSGSRIEPRQPDPKIDSSRPSREPIISGLRNGWLISRPIRPAARLAGRIRVGRGHVEHGHPERLQDQQLGEQHRTRSATRRRARTRRSADRDCRRSRTRKRRSPITVSLASRFQTSRASSTNTVAATTATPAERGEQVGREELGRDVGVAQHGDHQCRAGHEERQSGQHPLDSMRRGSPGGPSGSRR